MSRTETSDAPVAKSDEMFVGYLPMPPRLRRFTKWVVAFLMLAFVVAAWLVKGSYRTPGNGKWDTTQVQEFSGTLAARPCAMIRVADEQAESGMTWLPLVQEGKRGATDLALPLEGREVRVRGHILERDGRRLLELTEPIAATDAMRTDPAPGQVSQELVTLRGEIIDPKCYFGAMKPGEGKTHKACATLCIAGGIPPMLLVRDDERRTYYLLSDVDGGPVNEKVLPYVADPVEITGRLERRDDLTILRMDAGAIRRVGELKP